MHDIQFSVAIRLDHGRFFYHKLQRFGSDLYIVTSHMLKRTYYKCKHVVSFEPKLYVQSPSSQSLTDHRVILHLF